MSEEKLSFQAEVSRLLDIVAHSLYSDKEVFLRELVSNASDACDKLRYQALTRPELVAGDAAYRVRLDVDETARTLTVTDNGIGMDRAELIENLGTIARSGTANFVSALAANKEEGKKDVSLIGQFGVGFYAAFMVAGQVDVYSRKAGESQGWRWSSDGKGGFTVVESDEAPARGTRIVLHLRDGEDDYLQPYRLRAIIKKYSDHVAIPVLIGDDETPANAASALWTRPKAEITPEQYTEFYHHVGHGFDDPWLTLHWRAEGNLEYTSLLFIPSAKPFDLFEPERRHGVKLYVRRVFITDGAPGLIPPYLRFVKGVVDSEDLPLNVSREMLQHNPMLAKIRQGLTRRILADLARKAEDEGARAEYAVFWDNFGAVLKEGLYEDREQRDALLKLLRAHSTHSDELTGLEAYVGRMRPGQDAIYYITGEDRAALARSPHLEGFRAKGVEVLLLTDPVDEFWLQSVAEYKGHTFKSVTRADSDLAKVEGETKEEKKAETPGIADLVALVKLTLGEVVKDVRASDRLRESAVCLVADEGDMDMHLERLLKAHRKLDAASKRILELNPEHPLVRRLADLATAKGAGDPVLADAAWLLLDQARILENQPLPDPVAFGRRLATFVEKGLA